MAYLVMSLPPLVEKILGGFSPTGQAKITAIQLWARIMALTHHILTIQHFYHPMLSHTQL